MRDLHIEALVRQHGGVEGRALANCPIVRQFRWALVVGTGI